MSKVQEFLFVVQTLVLMHHVERQGAPDYNSEILKGFVGDAVRMSRFIPEDLSGIEAAFEFVEWFVDCPEGEENSNARHPDFPDWMKFNGRSPDEIR